MKQVVRALVGAALVALSSLAAADSVTFDDQAVDSKTNSLGGGTAMATGVFLVAGQEFLVHVDPTQVWNNSWGNPTYDSNADGHDFQKSKIDGLFDSIGSLVARVGNGPLFHVGTSFEGSASNTGELFFYYFDDDAYNNVGTVQASVTVVSEPERLALMAAAFAAFALTRHRRSRQA